MDATATGQKWGGLEGRKYPCPACGVGREVRLSKKGMPYLVCDGCNLQVFVRSDRGAKRMAESFESPGGVPADQKAVEEAWERTQEAFQVAEDVAGDLKVLSEWVLSLLARAKELDGRDKRRLLVDLYETCPQGLQGVWPEEVEEVEAG